MLKFAAVFGPDTFKFAPNMETIICLCICAVFAIFAIVIGIVAKKHDYKKAPKGMLLLIDWAVERIDEFTHDNMGAGFEDFGGIILGVAAFLISNFLIGIIGLPTPMGYLPIPLTLGLTTFLLIHITAVRFNKWKYFKRYIDPIPVFLPVNLLSMWAPLLSLSLRLFGNAVVGTILLTLVNVGIKNLGDMLFTFMAAEPKYIALSSVMTPLLHAYFDAFGALIQALVFVYLTTLLVAHEKPDDYDEQVMARSRKENK